MPSCWIRRSFYICSLYFSTQLQLKKMGSGESTAQDDFRDLPPSCLDKFIAEQLQPDERFHSLVSTALDSLCRYLQSHMRPPTVRRLIKGGSMGKGTALKGKSDLDCILIMNGILDAHQLKKKLGTILKQLKQLLNKDPLVSSGWRISIIRVNRFMVQIKMTNVELNKSVEVDLLPTFDAEVSDDYSRDLLYKTMPSYSYDTKQFCSAALAELQRNFVKSKPTKLKNLIRLVKHWSKTYLQLGWWDSFCGSRKPNSYLLELLTIEVWENAGRPTSFNTASLFKDVMVALYRHKQLDVYWDDYYSQDMIEVRRAPRVVDPANPYNNVYDVVSSWSSVKSEVLKTLNKPLFREILS